MTKLDFSGYIAGDVLRASVEAALNTRPVAGAFLFGPAGSGKTFLAETVAREAGGSMFFYQCFPGTREDDLMVKILPCDTTPSGVALHDGVIWQAIVACQSRGRRPVHLILDEWDKTRPSADSFLLDLLQSGRVNFNGRSAHLTSSQLSRLRVWITLNDEREIGEPLLRRLPMITVPNLAARDVQAALEITHAAHPQLLAAVTLYARSLAAGLPKPATIQELRQLLDAITCLGSRADWDALVRQYVTKTAENHALLRAAEPGAPSLNDGRLDPSAYEDAPPAPAVILPRLPRLAQVRGITSVADDAPAEMVGITIAPDLADAGGVVALTDTAYDAVVGMAMANGDAPGDDPAIIGTTGHVVGGAIVIAGPVPLEGWNTAPWGCEGEVLLMLDAPSPMAWMGLFRKKFSGQFTIARYSAAEIIGRATGIHIRWTPNRLEIVADLASGKNMVDRLVSAIDTRSAIALLSRGLPLVPDTCKTQGDYYALLGISPEQSANWNPGWSKFNSDDWYGWMRFLREVRPCCASR
jgi:MoxR-like ATPase